MLLKKIGMIEINLFCKVIPRYYRELVELLILNLTRLTSQCFCKIIDLYSYSSFNRFYLFGSLMPSVRESQEPFNLTIK